MIEGKIKWLSHGTMKEGCRVVGCNLFVPDPTWGDNGVELVSYVKKNRRLFARFKHRRDNIDIGDAPWNLTKRGIYMQSSAYLEWAVEPVYCGNLLPCFELNKYIPVGIYMAKKINNRVEVLDVYSKHGDVWYGFTSWVYHPWNITNRLYKAIQERLPDFVKREGMTAELVGRMTGCPNRSTLRTENSRLKVMNDVMESYEKKLDFSPALESKVLTIDDLSVEIGPSFDIRQESGYDVRATFLDVVGKQDFLDGKYDYSKIDAESTPEEVLSECTNPTNSKYVEINGQQQIQLIKVRVRTVGCGYFERAVDQKEFL